MPACAQASITNMSGVEHHIDANDTGCSAATACKTLTREIGRRKLEYKIRNRKSENKNVIRRITRISSDHTLSQHATALKGCEQRVAGKRAAKPLCLRCNAHGQ